MSYPPYDGQQQAPRGGSGLAIGALVLGILALLFCWTVVGGILLGLIAIVLGFIASGRAKRGVATGRGMAITGIVLGLLGLLISVGIVVAATLFVNSDSAKNLTQCVQDANGDQAAIEKCKQDFQRQLQN